MDARLGNALNDVCRELGLVWKYEPTWRMVSFEVNPKLKETSPQALRMMFSRRIEAFSVNLSTLSRLQRNNIGEALKAFIEQKMFLE